MLGNTTGFTRVQPIPVRVKPGLWNKTARYLAWQSLVAKKLEAPFKPSSDPNTIVLMETDTSAPRVYFSWTPTVSLLRSSRFLRFVCFFSWGHVWDLYVFSFR